MITYVLGDIFISPATVLVNTVNTVGVMGKGIAKDFKTYFPEMFVTYQNLCESGEFTIGSLFYFRAPHKSVLNFPTKRHWKQKSQVENIEAGLAAFVAKYEQYSIQSIAFPQLGCGNGELDWEQQVQPLMERYLRPLPITIYIHLYDGSREFLEHRNVREMKRWLREQPESLPFSEVWDDLAGVARETSAVEMDGSWTIGTLFGDESEPALVLRRGVEEFALSVDELRSIWQQLRSFGFFSVSDLGAHLEPVAPAILDLLSMLKYIERSRFFTMHDTSPLTIESPMATLLDDGIRLVPCSPREERINQLELIGFA